MALLIVGPPLLLWTFRTVFLPDRVPTVQEVVSWLTEQDTGQVFLLVLAIVGVIAWLQLVVAVLLECVALLRGVTAPRLPGIRWAQRLVAGVLFGLLVGTTAAEAEEYTVVPGDSLTSIAAEQLGDESRHKEIFELNQGRHQPDGGALRSVELIKPGWRLTLPDKPQCVDIVVKSGDTLTRLAREHLGSAERYLEIFELNEGRPQPGGRTLTDPDVIHPGDVLRLPGVLPPAPGGGGAPAGSECTPEVGAAPPLPQVNEPKPPSKRVSDPIPVERAADSVDDVAPLVTVGLGGLLAAGVLMVLARRRMLAQRRRAPGHRIRRSSAPGLETTLRKSEEPATADALDAALRALAHRIREEGTSLPAVRSVVVGTRGVILYPQRHRESFDDLPGTDELAGVPAPYPALVTLGHDLRRDLVLVNLVEIGTITLDGTEEEVEAVLSAMAWELATSTWADSVEVALVGFGSTSAECHPGRLRHFASMDEFLDAGVIPAGVVLSAEPFDSVLHEGLAVVTTARSVVSDGWRLDISAKSTMIDELGIEVELQRLTATQVEELVVTFGIEDKAEQVPADGQAEIPFEPRPVTGPDLRLLGPVGLHHVDLDRVEGKKINRLTELAAFLMLHPGATAAEISHQLGTDTRPWSPATRQGYISRLRTWLGRDENGGLYLPNVEANGGGYRLSDSMNSDWHRFRQLTARGPNGDGVDRRARLGAALELVTGMPFSNITPGRYSWNSWHQREMIDAIVDVAHDLAEISQKDGDLPAARRAILRGLVAEPVSELLYRDLLRVEYRAGNLAAVKATVDKLTGLAAALDVDLDEETAALVNSVMGPGEGRFTSDLPCTHSKTSR
ncbi:LysM peptidoglycan-binding domain-containing protein [Amycolatopsis japonica]|uniref:LysM peptidoglycan-binding domain-containing protein n=1 Tax=Amycolatopsis japonica TaxID=208439 RepID=UPI00366F7A42